MLARYNCALVQGLIGSAQEVTIELREHSQLSLAEAARTILRAAMFHRIVVTATATDDSGVMTIVCSGPAAVLEQQQAYASHLALLVPSILGLPGGWCLRAKVEDKRRDLRGELVVDPGDAPFPARTAAFIPPEIAAAGQALSDKLGSEWSVEPGLPVTLPSGQMLAPDWQCGGPGDRQVVVEVFHRWHAGPLRRRLQHRRKGELPAIVVAGS